MSEYVYSKNDVCNNLGISGFTLDKWYMWEAKDLQSGEVKDHYLPIPIKDKTQKGCPRRWTLEMIIDLKDFQSKMVRGRNGKYGKYTNSAWH